MTVKTGRDHLASLRDGREIYVDGKRVSDVTTDPHYARAVGTSGLLYDYQADPKNIAAMTFESPSKPGTRVNMAWQMPRSYAELVERRKALEDWAKIHQGFMGRSPDHVASCLTGMVMGLKTFEDYDPKRAGALRDYHTYARDNDLYVTYVIINPQADRSKAAHQQADEFLAAGVVDEDSQGITIRGGKMLATGGVMSNEVLVSCIQPLVPGDEKQAVSFCIPMNAKGLKILSRKSYEAAAPEIFDNPLSAQFDENDSVLYFDDVKVPWDRVFVDKNIEMTAAQWHKTPAHVLQNYQCQIRLMVKLRFLVAVAKRITEVNGTFSFPPVRETLGQLAAEVGMVEAMVYGMEAKGTMWGDYYVPDRHFLYSAQVITQQLYGKIITTMRDLAGGGVIMLPSSIADFNNPAIRSIIGKTQKSPATDSEERVKFFKLAWDAIGSEFASRHTQYEMFYAGATFVSRGHSFRTFNWASADAQLNSLLKSYDLDAASVAAE